MPMYRKKPITIEAREVPDVPREVRRGSDEARAAYGAFNGIAEWVGESGYVVDDAVDGACIMIDTPEGTMKARAGDFVIRGVQGEFYPCKGDIFRATYEAVDADA